MKKEYQQLPSYPLRLEPETRAKLEAIAKANGRSLHAEISMRLEDSLLPRPTAEWKQILDPAVYSLLEGESSRWSQTFEEALNYRLQLAFDKRLTGLLLDDLSSEAEALKMSEGRTVSIGAILDRRVRDGYLKMKQTAYPFSDPENLQEQKYDGSKFDSYADEFMKELVAQTVRDQLAKAGIVVPGGQSSQNESDHTNEG
ncbi:TraY domain-containing protein [Thiothrix winogradskyi]|uniref:Relaxosome protein TraY n=1 Tax=Thiothrix winogradskyi TaxID=96472 RepID=A0ABY3SVK0_9GAMM|nr:TraY domain-containing protein [Thiothrix winogradskyi]UJS23522.1 TraY domain-containing protein [Thiothrix winogradskyi]